MINLSRHLPVSRIQPLKSADDWYIKILKNKIKNFGNLSLGESWNMLLYLCAYKFSCVTIMTCFYNIVF
jgi:hypothetical protein